MFPWKKSEACWESRTRNRLDAVQESQQHSFFFGMRNWTLSNLFQSCTDDPPVETESDKASSLLCAGQLLCARINTQTDGSSSRVNHWIQFFFCSRRREIFSAVSSKKRALELLIIQIAIKTNLWKSRRYSSKKNEQNLCSPSQPIYTIRQLYRVEMEEKHIVNDRREEKKILKFIRSSWEKH